MSGQDQNSFPPKLLGQKRIEGPHFAMDKQLVLNQENIMDNGGLKDFTSLHQVEDSQVRLSHPDILKRKTLFKKHTPYTVSFNLSDPIF